MAKFVRRVYVVFEKANQYFPRKKIKNLGHLIQNNIFEVPAPNFKTSMKTITVLGGSQGSMKINAIFCSMLEENINSLQNKITVVHQTGAKDYEHIAKRFKSWTNVDAPGCNRNYFRIPPECMC